MDGKTDVKRVTCVLRADLPKLPAATTLPTKALQVWTQFIQIRLKQCSNLPQAQGHFKQRQTFEMCHFEGYL